MAVNGADADAKHEMKKILTEKVNNEIHTHLGFDAVSRLVFL